MKHATRARRPPLTRLRKRNAAPEGRLKVALRVNEIPSGIYIVTVPWDPHDRDIAEAGWTRDDGAKGDIGWVVDGDHVAVGPVLWDDTAARAGTSAGILPPVLTDRALDQIRARYPNAQARDVTDQFEFFATDAPKTYDGFGTFSLADGYAVPGWDFDGGPPRVGRVVAVPRTAAAWQRSRYGSGLRSVVPVSLSEVQDYFWRKAAAAAQPPPPTAVAETMLLDQPLDPERNVRLFAGAASVRVELFAPLRGEIITALDLGAPDVEKLRAATRALVALRDRLAGLGPPPPAADPGVAPPPPPHAALLPASATRGPALKTPWPSTSRRAAPAAPARRTSRRP